MLLRSVLWATQAVLASGIMFVCVGPCAASTEVRHFTYNHVHSEVSFEGLEDDPGELARASFMNAVAKFAPGGTMVAVYEGSFHDELPAGRRASFEATCVRVERVPVRSPDRSETAQVNLSLVFEADFIQPVAIFTDPSSMWLAPNSTTLSDGTFWEANLSKTKWAQTVDVPVEPLESSAIDVLEEIWRATSRHPLRSGGQIVLRPRSLMGLEFVESVPVDQTTPLRRINLWLCQHLGVDAGSDLRGGRETMVYLVIQDRGTLLCGTSSWR